MLLVLNGKCWSKTTIVIQIWKLIVLNLKYVLVFVAKNI